MKEEKDNVGGVEYLLVAGVTGCHGCIAENNDKLCMKLSGSCLEANKCLIWIIKPQP